MRVDSIADEFEARLSACMHEMFRAFGIACNAKSAVKPTLTEDFSRWSGYMILAEGKVKDIGIRDTGGNAGLHIVRTKRLRKMW